MGWFNRKVEQAQRAGAEPQKGGTWLGGFKQGLQKLSLLLNTDIRDLFKHEGKDGRLVDEAFLTDLFAILVKTDMGAGPAGEIRDRVQSDFRGRVVRIEDVLGTVKQQFRELLAEHAELIKLSESGPTVIMVVGVNGSGKTTSIAKLGYYFRQQSRAVVVGAGDTFRAGAVRQLAIWCGTDLRRVCGRRGKERSS